MNKVKAYMIVKGLSADEVGKKVNELIKNGFQPLGGLSVASAEGGGTWFCQAIVQYEE